MRYRYCGGTTIKDRETDGWAHDCPSFSDRLNEQDDHINKLEARNKVLEEENKKLKMFIDEQMDLHLFNKLNELEAINKKYTELIMAVGSKYEDETRHETALRYIREGESNNSVVCEEAAS